MTDKITKFLNSLEKKTKEKLKQKLTEIKKSSYKSSHIKKLKGSKNLYRMRLGKIRIIFQMDKKEINIIDIDFRGNIYK